MRGFRKYLKALIDESVRVIDSSQPALRSRESVEIWANHLFNLPGPKSLTRNLSPSEVVFREVFYGFNEIFETHERLEDFQAYLARLSYKGSRVGEVRHLRYTIENYLNEMYILRERLLAYGQRLRRYMKRRFRRGDTDPVFDRVTRLVENSLAPIVRTRGANIHERRYTDDDLRRLASLELLVIPGGMRQLRGWYRKEMVRIRRKWRDTIRANNRQVRKILDVYFTALHPCVFGPKLFLIQGGERRGK